MNTKLVATVIGLLCWLSFVSGSLGAQLAWADDGPALLVNDETAPMPDKPIDPELSITPEIVPEPPERSPEPKKLTPAEDQQARFTMPVGFRVEQLVSSELAGSVMATAFTEHGDLLISQEDGPLMIVPAHPKRGLHSHPQVFCADVQNCQGILPLNGQVYVLGEASTGLGLYRISDEDLNGRADRIEQLLSFAGKASEYGPHGLTLGPEGLIYIVHGYNTRSEKAPEPTSPYHHAYEGDLIQPRYEDPTGQAAGVRAPGGMVLRTDTEGSFVEWYAGGFRNVYDLAFAPNGELFVADSDAGQDRGMPWYRPSSVFHVVPGGEYGWRSGWAKMPNYYPERLPAVGDLTIASPSGVTFYDHNALPKNYRGAMLICDWEKGQILAVRMEQQKAHFAATSEVLVRGRPLHLTDVTVGPDGWVYFTAGRRGSEGGVFRLVYEDDVEQTEYEGILAAINQPQVHSAFGRDAVARIKQKLGDEWTKDLVTFIATRTNPAEQRAKALELMQLVGPFPSHKFLVTLSKDPAAEVRAKAAWLMGIHTNEDTAEALAELVDDPDPLVQRIACHAFVRARQMPPVDKLLLLLGESPRTVRWTAMRTLQSVPQKFWADKVLSSTSSGTVIWGSVGLLAIKPEDKLVARTFQRGRELMQGYVSDEDFISLLRLFELCLQSAEYDPEFLASFGSQVANEYPAGDIRMNRELIRLLAHLKNTEAFDRMMQELVDEKNPETERIHLGLHLRYFKEGWSSETKRAVLNFYEKMRLVDGGSSAGRYVDNVARDYLAMLSPLERGQLLARGEELPGMSLQILRSVPQNLSGAQIEALIQLDKAVSPQHDMGSQELKTGLVAVLGGSGDETALEYLREMYRLKPERREDIAMALASQTTEDQEANKKNWPLLIRSLPIVEGAAAEMVLDALANIRLKPVKSEPARQVIMAGLRLKDERAFAALEVLRLWYGQQLASDAVPASDALKQWQIWFEEEFPDSPPAELVTPSEGKYTYEELLAHLTSEKAHQADPAKGWQLFLGKAKCAACHHFADYGEKTGPDLSSISTRFQRKEILQALMAPSQVVSEKHRTERIVTSDQSKIEGLVHSDGGATITVLKSDGTKVQLKQGEIESRTVLTKSSMPAGLLEKLTLEEIADLFAFLTMPPRVASSK